MTGKKIVSKSAYASNMGQKAFLSLFGRGTILLGGIGLAVMCGLVILCLLLTIAKGDLIGIAMALFLFVIIGGGSILLIQAGRRAIQDARQIDVGVPLTRANTADLPAPDSLVRASSEPVQAHDTVLLRAAADRMETPPEQLVRASAGQE